MDMHALSVLEDATCWEWPITQRIQESGVRGGKYKAITPQLLSCLIKESQKFGGTVVDQFWVEVQKCHSKLEINVDNLRRAPLLVSLDQSSTVLFEGVERETINFKPIFSMAEEYFTHLGVAFMNPGGPKSGSGTPFSVSDVVAMETDELLRIANEGGFGKRKQQALKALAFKRDGQSCVVANVKLNQLPTDSDYDSVLAHVIPNSIHGKSDTLRCLAMFAGTDAVRSIAQHLNGIRNVMNLELHAHKAYDNLKWGIEAHDVNGTVNYFYRRIPFVRDRGPAMIPLRDGDEIRFGLGSEGERHGGGPDPFLCNIQLAVARVMKMSGAAEVIAQVMEDADDSDFPQVYLASDNFCDILDAKLVLKGIHV